MSQYDSRTTTFSPEGRLHQVEYALETINNASSTIGIVTKEGVVLAADKALSSPLLEQNCEREKIYVLADHMLVAVAGLTADANVLLHEGRVSAQRHCYRYDEPILVESSVTQICDLKQSYTQFGGLRPFGVSFMFAGHDQTKGFQLYHTDPAGNYSAWKATAIGQNSVSAQVVLKQHWKEGLTLDEGLLLAAKVLTQTTDSASPNAEMNEVAVLSMENGKPKHRFLTTPEVTDLLRRAASENEAPAPRA